MAEAALDLDIQPLIEAIRKRVSVDFEGDNTGHDLAHLDRVHGLTEKLRLVEGGDPLVLAAACYVHDYHRVLERLAKEHSDEVRGHVDEQLINGVLAGVEFPSHLVRQVFECVEFTDKYSFAGHALGSPSREARILRDADNLDAIGAVGIARAFMFGGALGEPIWVDGVDPSEVYEAGTTTSVVHHFHEKLLRIRDDMLTEAGQAIASQRHDFMVAFLDQLGQEWDTAGLGSQATIQVS